MFDLVGAWAHRHMLRFGYEKTGVVLFNPDPDNSSYPGGREYTQLAMVTKEGAEVRGVQMIDGYEYLGLDFDDEGGFAKFLRTSLLPAVRVRL